MKASYGIYGISCQTSVPISKNICITSIVAALTQPTKKGREKEKYPAAL
tara:strand:- start:38 stop:184 length:147 start_codon:yes stop_codon:yes gene_type:complete